METMNERLLQYIWQFQYFDHRELMNTVGEQVQVLHPGQWNHHQGPDFSSARIRIGHTLWAGNIELHLRASDWCRHEHSTDPNYRNIILHVVWEEDVIIKDQYGICLPTLILRDRVPLLLLDRYRQMMAHLETVACHRFLPAVNELTWCAWKERLGVERLERKTKFIHHQLQQTQWHWEEVFWRLLAAGFGLKVNAAFFEQVAASIAWPVLLRHQNRLDEIEALLLGQAHLLDGVLTDTYPRRLQKIYRHLQSKYRLQQPAAQPAFLRMRPASFPTIRLAQLSVLIHQQIHLFDRVRTANTIEELTHLFHLKAGHYWNTHYRFDEPVTAEPRFIGRQMIVHLLVNVAIPMVFLYGQEKGLMAYKDKAIQWLYGLEPEQNKITRYWKVAGISNRSALDSQSLIELYTQYCVNKRCLDCSIGNKLLRS